MPCNKVMARKLGLLSSVESALAPPALSATCILDRNLTVQILRVVLAVLMKQSFNHPTAMINVIVVSLFLSDISTLCLALPESLKDFSSTSMVSRTPNVGFYLDPPKIVLLVWSSLICSLVNQRTTVSVVRWLQILKPIIEHETCNFFLWAQFSILFASDVCLKESQLGRLMRTFLDPNRPAISRQVTPTGGPPT